MFQPLDIKYAGRHLRTVPAAAGFKVPNSGNYFIALEFAKAALRLTEMDYRSCVNI